MDTPCLFIVAIRAPVFRRPQHKLTAPLVYARNMAVFSSASSESTGYAGIVCMKTSKMAAERNMNVKKN